MTAISKPVSLDDTESFVPRHIGPNARDTRAMLDALGYESLEQFITAAVPERIRFRRTLAIGAQVLHITATAAWIGVLLHVFFLRGSLATEPALAGKVVRRFSSIALSATTTILVTGVIALLRSLHSPGAVLGSAYGWTLLVKLALIVPAVLAGWTNFRHVGPELARSAAALPRFARMLELEVIAGSDSNDPGSAHKSFYYTPQYSRPMKELTWSGKLPGKASSDVNDANSCCNPGAVTWNTRSARDKSRRRCSPRSVRSMSLGSASRATSAAACETTICPPCATPIKRAARFSAAPK